MIKKIKRVLVLNRSEIACRIIQACQEAGKEAVAIYSEADRDGRHKELANKAVPLGKGSLKETYLHLAKILAIAKKENCDAVHPGYGFLSERSDAACAFTDAGIVWIGPSSKSISTLGNKITAKNIQKKIGISALPWEKINPSNPQDNQKIAQKIGYPLLVKAASGGGGKGMRLVKSEIELDSAIESAAREGKSTFGDSVVFLEKYLKKPRHIEVQILGDKTGKIMHLGERDCSTQRHHQKVIEEAPAPSLSIKTRTALCESAVAIAKAAQYENAGTVEFLVDEKENFYFLEMNARLQVEHSVTEAVWGIDLVHAQLKIAEGESLKKIAFQKSPRGHAIEARIYAEDPSRQFLPSPGKILKIQWPRGVNIRVDAAIDKACSIEPDYDPMIAKLTVWAESREKAIHKMLWSLSQTFVFGVVTNTNYLQDILKTKEFGEGKMHVKFLENEMSSWKDVLPKEIEQITTLATQAPFFSKKQSTNTPSPWDEP